MRPGNWTFGVDLGQVYDHTALAVVERVVEIREQPFVRAMTRDHCYVRYLQRWALGTHYRDVVADVGFLMKDLELEEAVIILDGTGVGREISQLFYQAFRLNRLGKYWPVVYVITAGRDITKELVPKRELVGTMQTLLQDKRFWVADDLPIAPLLKKEMENFRIKKRPETGEETYESARDGEHDDIVLACALACWYRHTMTQPRALADLLPTEVGQEVTHGENRSEGNRSSEVVVNR